MRVCYARNVVRQYHRDFYRPDNLAVVIVGQVELSAVFATLEPFEQRILSKGSLPPHQRYALCCCCYRG